MLKKDIKLFIKNLLRKASCLNHTWLIILNRLGSMDIPLHQNYGIIILLSYQQLKINYILMKI
jgi:hypothetical protein